MPLPQVNDRLKEIPAQALRTVFATIGQLLLAADRLRARATGQLPGHGEATATRPAAPAPGPAPAAGPAPAPVPAPAAAPVPPAKPARPAKPDAETSRWRSLDKTGNVRVLDGGEEQDDEDVPGVTRAVPEPAAAPAPPAEYTPTEVVPVVSVPAEPVLAEPAPAEPAMQQETEPAAAEPARSDPVPSVAAPDQALPVPNYDELPVPNYDELSAASLRARLRVLDAGQVQTLLTYEKAHESRPAVITMFERRLIKLGEGS